jgi:AcrR family transcriptional regulator
MGGGRTADEWPGTQASTGGGRGCTIAFTTMEPLSSHAEREWILIGMAESCAARGFERTGVDDVCAAAGVERASFERLFAGTEDCLAATMEMAVAEARRRLDAVHFPAKPWAAAVLDGTAAVLGLLAERPALARTAMVEAPAAGGRAAGIYADARGEALSFLERGRDVAGPGGGVPGSASRAALAGAETLVAGRVLAGRTAELGGLAGEVAYALTVPYLGQGEALRQSGRKTAFRHLRAVA